MKRIAIVAHGLSNGGAERVAALLANKFVEIGNEVLFIAVYSEKKEYQLEEKVKYKYINVKAKNKLEKYIKRTKFIDRELEVFSPDIVISFIINELIITNIKGKIPLIYTLRNDPHHLLRTNFNKIMCLFSYGRCKNVVFQTPEARDYFNKNIREKGIVIANPLTSNLPYWKDKEHKKTIITACRLAPQKNLKMLIDAFNIFRKENQDYTLEIYGEGPLLQELKEYCFKLKIEEYVKFPGYSKNIHHIMAESSIFVLSSDFEGLSNSMLEALAIGIPTVCTDCPPGGASLYIKDGINGMLVPVGDSKALANKIKMLVENMHLCENISRESIKIRNELDENYIIQQWNNIIESKEDK